MILNDYFDPKKTSKLIGYTDKFELFKKLISNGNFPSVVMITGDKGIGKFSFINTGLFQKKITGHNRLIMSKQKNVLGETLESCSTDPMTGWFRDGCCNTDKNDRGLHTVCVKVNDEFLQWCKEAGNDLITPHPEFGFPGLKDGDNWCVCAGWVARALDAGIGCSIYLKKTHMNT